MPPYLIVGIDPGTTIGLASIDLSGSIIELFSGRHVGVEKTIEHLISVGHVSLVATDVSPVPDFVSKIASSLGAPVFPPKEPLPVSQKNEMTKEFNPGDVHQRDALAAALNAFQHYKNKFQKIESKGLGDDVKDLVLQGISIEAAAEFLSEEEPKPQPKKKKSHPQKKELSQEEQMLRNLRRQVELLKEKITQNEEKIKALNDQTTQAKRIYRLELHKDKEIGQREHVIRNLDSSLAKMKKKAGQIEEYRILWEKIGQKEIQPVGIFPKEYGGLTFLRRKIKKKDWNQLEKAEVVFIGDLKDREFLIKKGIRTADAAILRSLNDCYYVKEKDLTPIKKKGLQRDLEEIVIDYRLERESNPKGSS
ncbi:MAG: DUF460 domain-containing protein [Candidatus Altiarchaeota archaeon]